MDAQGIDLLLAFHDGVHFIEKQNASGGNEVLWSAV